MLKRGCLDTLSCTATLEVFCLLKQHHRKLIWPPVSQRSLKWVGEPFAITQVSCFNASTWKTGDDRWLAKVFWFLWKAINTSTSVCLTLKCAIAFKETTDQSDIIVSSLNPGGVGLQRRWFDLWSLQNCKKYTVQLSDRKYTQASYQYNEGTSAGNGLRVNSECNAGQKTHSVALVLSAWLMSCTLNEPFSSLFTSVHASVIRPIPFNSSVWLWVNDKRRVWLCVWTKLPSFCWKSRKWSLWTILLW
jgi:hypothetical protein